MSNFVKDINSFDPVSGAELHAEVATPSTINKCVCGITNGSPYDSSVFSNNDTTFYTQLNYAHLGNLLRTLSSESSSDDVDPRIRCLNTYFRDPTVQVIFRFLCSPECHSGATFVNEPTTEVVFNFVKFVCFARPVIVEFSDHSMGSFFSNWKNDFMEMESPIEILPQTTSGSFKMVGMKKDFMDSVHPTLKQIGELSSDENVEITFNNMGDTKIFQIRESAVGVKLISSGSELGSMSRMFRYPGEDRSQLRESSVVYPVHCEFDYGRFGKIVVSATHWCNLDKVETEVDLPTLRRYCTEAFGRETTQELDERLASMSDPCEIKREMSSMVRGITSGHVDKKCKCDDPFC